jgi:Clostridial hydrophobic W
MLEGSSSAEVKASGARIEPTCCRTAITRQLRVRISAIAAAWLIGLLLASDLRSQELTEFVASSQPKVSGTVRIQSVGDEPLKDAEWAGRKSLARQLEGITLKLDAPEELLRVEYQCSVEDVGNVGWFTQGSRCGVEYQSRPKRLEAIQIRLAGRASARFTVKYECHIQGIGDVPAKADGQACGTYGEARRLEALRVWVDRRP